MSENKSRTQRIRVAIASSGIRYYALADKLGVSYNSLNRWLRSGVTEERFKRIMDAIHDLTGRDGL